MSVYEEISCNASRFTASQIIGVLKLAEAGTPVPELCHGHGISSATFYKWRSEPRMNNLPRDHD